MAPLPPILDPFKAVDRLPQPYRMIDKILAQLVEQAVAKCLEKAKNKRVADAAHIDTIISPHAAVIVDGQASCFTTLGVGGMVIVGTTGGIVMSHTARDPLLTASHQAHTSSVTALDIGHVAATGTKVVASASKDRVVIHEVVLRTSQLRQLAQVDLPQDPDLSDSEAPCSITFSTNAGHIAVCWPTGPVAVYEVALPTCLYDSAIVDRPPDAPPLDLTGGQLNLKVHFTVKVVAALLVGNATVGACHVVWQQQQRPDNTGKSDRNHRPAKGVYMWWDNCNKLALAYLNQDSPQEAGGIKLPPTSPEKAPAPQPVAAAPVKPAGKGSKAAAVAAATSPEPQNPSNVSDASSYVRMWPSKGWLLPMGISHSCSSENGKMLAFGLADGSTLVWDDHFGGHTKILPRMPAPVTAIAFVNGIPNLLFVTSADGSVYLSDLLKPEDSHMSKTKLPHAAHQVFFLPNDPFAVCVCNRHPEEQPRLVWFNMQDEKLVAELSGKNATQEVLGFGRAGLCVAPLFKQASEAEVVPAMVPTPSARTGKAAASQPVAPPVKSPQELADEAAAVEAAEVAALAQTMKRPWPAISFRDTYLVVGGPVQPAVSRPTSAAASGTDRANLETEAAAAAAADKLIQPSTMSLPVQTPAQVTAPETLQQVPVTQPEMPGLEAHLYLYKLDAIARMLLPEEMAGVASQSLLNRMLADLNPPKITRKTMPGMPLPAAAPKPPSAMRKAMDVDLDESLGGRRHIKFNESDLEGLLNDEQKSGKLFKKETIKGGYSDGRSKQISDPSGKGHPGSRKVDLSAYGGPGPNAAPTNTPNPLHERPKSPPWHHTNPLARIHPDWEEAAVLARIMEKLGSQKKGYNASQSRRDRNSKVNRLPRHFQTRMAKDNGPKPALLFQDLGPQ